MSFVLFDRKKLKCTFSLYSASKRCSKLSR